MESFLFILALFVGAFTFSKTEDSKAACENLAKCLTEAANEKKACDGVQAEIDKNWPPNKNEHQKSIREKILKLAEMNYNKRNEKVKCLQESLRNTTVVSCDRKKTEKCKKVVSSYKPIAVNASKSASNGTAFSNSTAKPDGKNKKGEASAKDNDGKKKMQRTLKECNRAAGVREEQCSKLASCCSESSLCDLKFQTTPAYTEIVKLQYALELERRVTTCSNQKGNTTTAKPSAKGTTSKPKTTLPTTTPAPTTPNPTTSKVSG